MRAAATAFVHPGLLVSSSDLSRASRHIAAGDNPWAASWADLISITYSQPDYVSQAVHELDRDTDGQYLWQDAAAAFNLALRWKIEGNATYAAASARILTSWAKTLTALIGGDDAYLSAGLQGYELANAAELLRDYTPFADSDDFTSVKKMLEDIFLASNIFFLDHLDGSEHNVLHFYANWELAQVASVMAIGVLTDNHTTWDFGVNYFKNGSGNGCVNNAVYAIVEEPGTTNGTLLGQGQEAGRDQGHSAMDVQLLAAIGKQAWTQGVDLYGYNHSRILLGTEYFARYNLGYDVPFVPYDNGIVSQTVISSASRGAIRPTWELLYSHYVQIKGVSAPWTTQYLNKSLTFFGGAFEGGAGSWGEGSGHYDGLGWGSLLYHMDAEDLAVVLASNGTASATASISAVDASVSAGSVNAAASVSTGAAVVNNNTSFASLATTVIVRLTTTVCPCATASL
ncbi:hypothetical protein SBRCBS47491_004489 [Sporothrix bragantina]|uniref:Alginate lyase domain-containing protein n=1 Tax=Sporothrix bragantina TaxID=671064 RepID=A0ABP0BPF1_9PEZI